MATATPPLPPRIHRQGPTLATLHMVERVLRDSDIPLSLNKIKEKLPRKVEHARLRDAVEHYKRLGCVVEGSKGVMWVLETDPEFWKVVDRWARW
jgi:hypothetical protein